MKQRQFFYALWLALAVYGSGTLLFGANGLFAYQAIHRETTRLESNIAKLQTINDGLSASLGALRSDAATVGLLAIELGFVEDGTRALRIAGLPTASHQAFPVGEQLHSVLPATVPAGHLRLIALFAGLAFWVISWARRGNIRGSKKPVSSKT